MVLQIKIELMRHVFLVVLLPRNVIVQEYIKWTLCMPLVSSKMSRWFDPKSTECLSLLRLCFLRSASLTPWQIAARKISLVIISLDWKTYIFLSILTYVLFGIQKTWSHPYSGTPVLPSYPVPWNCVWPLHNMMFAGLKQGVFWYFPVTDWESGHCTYCINAQHYPSEMLVVQSLEKFIGLSWHFSHSRWFVLSWSKNTNKIS